MINTAALAESILWLSGGKSILNDVATAAEREREVDAAVGDALYACDTGMRILAFEEMTGIYSGKPSVPEWFATMVGYTWLERHA